MAHRWRRLAKKELGVGEISDPTPCARSNWLSRRVRQWPILGGYVMAGTFNKVADSHESDCARSDKSNVKFRLTTSLVQVSLVETLTCIQLVRRGL